MKKATKLKAFMLSLIMTALLLPMTSFAQQTSDDFFRVDDAFNDNRAVAYALTGNLANDDFGAPLGSGLLILTAAGAGYAISRRKRSFRKGSALVLAALMLLGMTACKKKIAEPITPATGNQVAITLNVGGGAKAEVDPPHVTFETGDQILVASNGHYVGTLTHNGTNFSGSITDPEVGQPLYFYFLGNKDTGTLTPGASGSTSCTVIISDQTNYPHLPVISMGVSIDREHGNAIVNYSSGVDTYEAQLHNKASLIKFNVTTPSTAPICITGMNNQVTVKFNDRTSNDGFSYGMADANGVIKMKGVASSGAATWAIVLQQDELPAGAEGTAYTTDFSYVGARAAVPAITMDQYLNEDRPMTVSTHVWNGNLAALNGSEPEGFATARDGMTIYGTLDAEVKISIAAGAMVTLSGATINGTNNSSYSWAGLNCLGDATIILKDGSTNNVKGFYEDYPGIHVPAENTLTIKGETLGTGSLNASSYPVASGSGAGIGGGENLACGNIEIQGGVITATGSTGAAGIGSGNYGCGTITISGGTITATGGASGAGIGSGFGGGCGNITISGGIVTSTGGDFSAGIGGGKTGSCGNITIESTVTNVTAVRGTAGSYSIGRGDNGTCGTVTIGGVEGAISTSPYTYPTPVAPFGAIDGLFSVSSTKQVYFSKGNLQYQASTGTWRFAEHQYDFIGGGNFLSESNTEWIDLYRWGTSGINYTGHATLYRPWEWAYYSYYFNPYGSLTTNLYDGAGENAGKADWGYNAISNGGNSQNSGWRTLKNNTTDNEWQYIFNSRTTANEINSTSNARYTQARININDWAVRGIILFPDGSIGDTPSGVTWGTINAAASNWTTGTTQCTTAGWAALEAAGCVFLPAAGKYDDSGVSQAEINGYYWSSSYASDNNAYGMYFYSNEVNPQYSDARHYGLSVRLVKDAN